MGSPQNRQKTGKTNRTSFQPGRSGNPGGRPKLPEDIKAAYREMHPRALERVSAAIDSADERVALRAAEIIIERVEGRVPLGITMPGNVTINMIDPYAETPKSKESK